MDRRRFCLGIAGVAGFAIAPRSGDAQTMSITDAFARLFNAPQAQPQWFSASFLAAVPIEKVRAITDGIKANLGAYQSARFTGGRYTLTFARGSIRADAQLDAAGAFTTLLVDGMVSADAMNRITALFSTGTVPASWFSDAFLAAVPIEKSNAIIADIKARFGTFRSVAPATGGSYFAVFTGGTVNVQISLGADGKIESLLLRPV